MVAVDRISLKTSMAAAGSRRSVLQLVRRLRVVDWNCVRSAWSQCHCCLVVTFVHVLDFGRKSVMMVVVIRVWVDVFEGACPWILRGLQGSHLSVGSLRFRRM